MFTLCWTTLFIFYSFKVHFKSETGIKTTRKYFFFHINTSESSKNLNCVVPGFSHPWLWILTHIVSEVTGFNWDVESCAAASCQWRPAGISLDVVLLLPPLSIKPCWALLGGFVFLKIGTLKGFLFKKENTHLHISQIVGHTEKKVVTGSAEVTAYFLASSLEISSSVRPLVSGMQRKTNTSRAKLMAAWRNMTLGRPIFSEDSRAVEKLNICHFVVFLCVNAHDANLGSQCKLMLIL